MIDDAFEDAEADTAAGIDELESRGITGEDIERFAGAAGAGEADKCMARSHFLPQ